MHLYAKAGGKFSRYWSILFLWRPEFQISDLNLTLLYILTSEKNENLDACDRYLLPVCWDWKQLVKRFNDGRDDMRFYPNRNYRRLIPRRSLLCSVLRQKPTR